MQTFETGEYRTLKEQFVNLKIEMRGVNTSTMKVGLEIPDSNYVI